MTSPDATSRQQERTWVLRAQQGDTEAFGLLVDAYDRRLLYFIRRFVPDADRALDILQDVWLTLFCRLSGLRAPEAFRVWLYQIAHDRVVSLLRRARREERVYEALGPKPNGAAELPEPHLDRAELVHHGLDRLSPEHREVLVLRFLEGLALEEIARAVRCSPGTVKSRLHYAKQALRQEVEKILDD